MDNLKQTQHLWDQAYKLATTGNFEESLAIYYQLLKQHPHEEKIIEAAVEVNMIAGNFVDAKNLLLKLKKIKNFDYLNYHNLGYCNHKLFLIDDALVNINRAIEINNKFLQSYFCRSRIYLEKKQFNLALQDIDKAIKLYHSNKNVETDINFLAELFNTKGQILHENYDYKNAKDEYLKAIKLTNNFGYKINYGNSLFWSEGDSNNLKKYWLDLVRENPDREEGYNNYGLLLMNIGDYLEAKNYFDQALNINPKSHIARMNLSLIELSIANFKDGWVNYESRFYVDANTKYLIRTNKPKWHPKIKNNKVLIWGEQGIGDEILYSHLIDKKTFKPENTFLCFTHPKIIPLMRKTFEGYKVFSMQEVTNDNFFDCHIPIASLGQYFRKNISDFNNLNLIPVDLDRKKEFEKQYKNQNKKLIGISWKSQAGFGKNCELEDLLPLFTNPELNFVSLQYGDVSDEIKQFNKKFNANIIHPKDLDIFNDLDGLLSLIDSCDLIVTTSNINAHLAGSVNKETHLLSAISVKLFHYWYSQDGKSLWYPSIKIYKQNKKGDWEDPVIKVKESIQKLI